MSTTQLRPCQNPSCTTEPSGQFWPAADQDAFLQPLAQKCVCGCVGVQHYVRLYHISMYHSEVISRMVQCQLPCSRIPSHPPKILLGPPIFPLCPLVPPNDSQKLLSLTRSNSTLDKKQISIRPLTLLQRYILAWLRRYNLFT